MHAQHGQKKIIIFPQRVHIIRNNLMEILSQVHFQKHIMAEWSEAFRQCAETCGFKPRFGHILFLKKKDEHSFEYLSGDLPQGT